MQIALEALHRSTADGGGEVETKDEAPGGQYFFRKSLGLWLGAPTIS